MKKINIEVISLAFCIAVFPPLWAVLAPYIGIQTGAVALICAGLYVANGNKTSDALKISIGFLLGDLWAVLALEFMNYININKDLELFVTLFVFGGLVVIISALCSKWIYCPSWLCGWAIGLTILAPMGINSIGNFPVQIAVAMLIGVWYVGVGIDFIQKKIIKLFKTK